MYVHILFCIYLSLLYTCIAFFFFCIFVHIPAYLVLHFGIWAYYHDIAAYFVHISAYINLHIMAYLNLHIMANLP